MSTSVTPCIPDGYSNSKYRQMHTRHVCADLNLLKRIWAIQVQKGMQRPFLVKLVQSVHGQTVIPMQLFLLLISSPAAFILSCCKQTINQRFVGWMVHIHRSCCAQQKGKINKEQARASKVTVTWMVR